MSAEAPAGRSAGAAASAMIRAVAGRRRGA
jgi:hypothetical protein